MDYELRKIDESGERTLRTGPWEALMARLELYTTPNGTYAMVSPTRRCVLSKTGNYGDGQRNGTVTIIEDTEK